MEQKKNITIFVQAREDSKRFKHKIFAKIQNKPIYQLIYERLKLCKISNNIFFLIPNKNNKKLKYSLNKIGIPFYEGNEADVLDRFYKGSKFLNSDIIVRVTADCPLADPNLIDKMVKIFLKQNLDYLSNTYPPTFPDGFDIEIFSCQALKKIKDCVKYKIDKEHVTSFIKSNPSKFKIGNVNLNFKKDFSKFRLTVDYKDDLLALEKVLKNFHPKIKFNYRDVIKFINKTSLPKSNYVRNIAFNKNKSIELWQKALKIIPSGNSFLSKNPKSFNEDNWPTYYSSTSKQYVWSYDQIKYLDMSMMSVGTNSLGYNNKNIDKKVSLVIKKGNMSSLNCPEEVYLAEKLVDIHKWSEMVKFARTGSEANCIALRAARLATGKEKIIVCGYHGWHDWYLAANLKDKSNLNNHLFKDLQIEGVPKNLKDSIYSFEYNNFENLKKILDKDKNIAALIMEVKRDENPKNDFLKKIREICNKKNVVLIFDECTSAFRENFGGLYLKHGIAPDLAMFGKALGNGYPITAVVGKKSIMETLTNSFVSSTFWSDRIGPSAGIATLLEMEKKKSWEKLLKNGKYFRKKFSQISNFKLIDINKDGIVPNISLKLSSEKVNKKLLISFFLEKNILTSDRIYLSSVHTKKNIDSYFNFLEMFLEQAKSQKQFFI